MKEEVPHVNNKVRLIAILFSHLKKKDLKRDESLKRFANVQASLLLRKPISVLLLLLSLSGGGGVTLAHETA